MAEVIIRQAVPGDAGSIYEIENLCFPDPWSMDALTYELEGNPRAFYIVAELDGEVVGYAGLWIIGDEGHITNVAVKPGFRNRKIGEGIIGVMIDFTSGEGIAHYTLEVRKGCAHHVETRGIKIIVSADNEYKMIIRGGVPWTSFQAKI